MTDEVEWLIAKGEAKGIGGRGIEADAELAKTDGKRSL